MNKEKQIKAALPSGFKDRSGDELALKKKLLDIIEKNFIKFGFSPLETSPMELSSVIGNSLSEDDENPMADIFTYDENGTDKVSVTGAVKNPGTYSITDNEMLSDIIKRAGGYNDTTTTEIL